MLRGWWDRAAGGATGQVFGEAGRSAMARFEELAVEAGAPGGRSRREVIDRQVVYAGAGALLAAVVVASLVDTLVASVAIVGASGTAAAGGILSWWWRRLPDHDGELPRAVVAWRWGAEGERRTAALLRPLTEEGWSILHDRACPDSEANIDHLAVGPNGLFVIDSKMWRDGRIRAGDSYRQVVLDAEVRDISGVFHEVRQAWRAVRDIMVEADVGVRPVVVVHGATVEEGGLRSEHGDLIDAHDIGRYLRSQATGELDSDQIARITRIIQDRFEAAG